MKELLFICERASKHSIISSTLLPACSSAPPHAALRGQGGLLWLKGTKELISIPYQTPLEAGGTALRLYKTLVQAPCPSFPPQFSGVSSGEVASSADPVWKIQLCEAGGTELL